MKDLLPEDRFKVSHVKYVDYEKGIVIEDAGFLDYKNLLPNFKLDKYINDNIHYYVPKDQFIKGEHSEYVDAVLAQHFMPLVKRYFFGENEMQYSDETYEKLEIDVKKLNTVSALSLRKVQAIFRTFYISSDLLDDLERLLEAGVLRAQEQKHWNEEEGIYKDAIEGLERQCEQLRIELGRALERANIPAPEPIVKEIKTIVIQPDEDSLHKIEELQSLLAEEKQKRLKAEGVIRRYFNQVFENEPATDDVGQYYWDLMKDKENADKEVKLVHAEQVLILQRLVDECRKQREEQERLADKYYYQLSMDILGLKDYFTQRLHTYDITFVELRSSVNEGFMRVSNQIMEHKMFFNEAIMDIEKNQMLLASGIDKRFLEVQQQVGQFGIDMQKMAHSFEEGKVDLRLMTGQVENMYDKFESNVRIQNKAVDYALKQIALQDGRLADKLAIGLLEAENKLKDGKYALKELGYTNALAAKTFQKEAGDVLRDVEDVQRDINLRNDWNQREMQMDRETAQLVHELRQKDIQKEKAELQIVRNEIAHETQLFDLAKTKTDSETQARSRIAEFNMTLMKKREKFMINKINELQATNDSLTWSRDAIL